MNEPEGAVPGLPDELRALIREVIRDQLGAAGSAVETVDLSTDADLAAFVTRLLDLDPADRDDIRSGRKRFRLATAPTPSPASPTVSPSLRVLGVARAMPVRRVERGAVTERMVREAARAGERVVLGPGAVLTPLARDRARTSGVEIEKER